MHVTVLVEDSSCCDNLESEHGLSLAIESFGRLRLFDVGGSGMFARNAARLGIAVEDADALFLSHGHRDHTGGLETFLRLNTKAVVYGMEKTFAPYYSLRKTGVYENIGTPAFHRDPRWAGRIVLNPGMTVVDSNTTLFSDVKTNDYMSEANSNLYMRGGAHNAVADGSVPYVHDDFEHEQSLIAKTEDGRSVLFVGCSHRGVVNIMARCVEILGRAPDAAVGGFHLMIPSRGETIPYETLDKIAERLANWPTVYYTGHCAGRKAYDRVKLILGERISYFGVGDVMNF